MNLFTKQKQSHRLREELTVAAEEREWGEREGVRDGHVQTAVFKMDHQQGPTVYHRGLCSVLCGSLDGRRAWGRMETWLSPYAVHLEPSQHCYLVTFQYKIKSSIKKNLKNINRLLDTVGEGEGGMIWEKSIETYALPYVR